MVFGFLCCGWLGFGGFGFLVGVGFWRLGFVFWVA